MGTSKHEREEIQASDKFVQTACLLLQLVLALEAADFPHLNMEQRDCLCRAVSVEDIIERCSPQSTDTASPQCPLQACSDLDVDRVCKQCIPGVKHHLRTRGVLEDDSGESPVGSPMLLGRSHSFRNEFQIVESGQQRIPGDRELHNPSHGWYRIPIVSALKRLWNIIFRPIEVFAEFDQRYDSKFVYEVPGFFTLAFVPGKFYEKIYRLPPSVIQIGPVYGNIPAVGMWMPRKSRFEDHEALQELVVRGKRLIATLLSHVDLVGQLCKQTSNEILCMEKRYTIDDKNGIEFDLFDDICQLVYNVFLATICGDEVATALNRQGIGRLLRRMNTDIDIPRATLASLPLARFMPEYTACMEIHLIISEVLQTHRDTSFVRHVCAASPSPEDEAWMMFFVLWNTSVYSGSYIPRTLYEMLHYNQRRPSLNTGRTDKRWISNCFLETVRLYPVGSVTRQLRKSIRFKDDDGHWYFVPKGHFIGAFPYQRNREVRMQGGTESTAGATDFHPELWETADRNPQSHLLFGSGTYGCPAAQLSTVGCFEVLHQLLTRWSLRWDKEMAYVPGHCRIHLLYEQFQFPIVVTKRVS